MIRMATLHRMYLISLLVLLQTSLAGSMSAGTDVWMSNEPRGGQILDLANDPAILPAQRRAPVIPARGQQLIILRTG